MKHGAIPLCVALAAVNLFSSHASAQGGPPFRTDDPDTPGNRHWEINLGLIGDRNPFQGSYAAPNFDVNYGLGDRIQLKYELPLSIQELRGNSGHVAYGLGNSLIGFKWRFYQYRPETELPGQAPEGKASFAMSFYPQFVFNNPTRSVSRGIVEPGPQFLLPMEANASFGPIRIAGEIGYWFGNKDVPNSWMRGMMVGHEFKSKTELYLELHDQYEVNGTAHESTLGVGGRQPVAGHESVLFIGMAGHSLRAATPTNHQPDWIAYLGVQFRPGSGKKAIR
jgi:hypothetical protein